MALFGESVEVKSKRTWAKRDALPVTFANEPKKGPPHAPHDTLPDVPLPNRTQPLTFSFALSTVLFRVRGQ